MAMGVLADKTRANRKRWKVARVEGKCRALDGGIRIELVPIRGTTREHSSKESLFRRLEIFGQHKTVGKVFSFPRRN